MEIVAGHPADEADVASVLIGGNVDRAAWTRIGESAIGDAPQTGLAADALRAQGTPNASLHLQGHSQLSQHARGRRRPRRCMQCSGAGLLVLS